MDVEHPSPEAATESPTPMAPVQNRFLFVDIAALRAKQLRRGALPRLHDGGEPHSRPTDPHKPERIAMEEVRRGLVQYDVPAAKPHQLEGA
jgi:DNA-directed RNA polymerase omega subunit